MDYDYTSRPTATSAAASSSTALPSPAKPTLPSFSEIFGASGPTAGDATNANASDRAAPAVASSIKRPALYEIDSHPGKRSHEETFGHAPDRPLQNGQRPDPDPIDPAGAPPSGLVAARPDTPMEYRRADGSVTTKYRQAAWGAA
jgi:hypothetical protein